MGLGKARKEAAEPWKLRLYETPPSDFATAQQLMDVIADITGQKPGKLGGKIQPRICTSCGHWGHTKEYCVYWTNLYEEKYGPSSPKHTEDLDYNTEEDIPRVEYTEVQWRWVCEFRRLMDRYDKACDEGCQYGIDYELFCDRYDSEHPQFPAGSPYNLTKE